ncbi:hypothetical protein Tco_0137740 [Tanacetum coccineum]
MTGDNENIKNVVRNNHGPNFNISDLPLLLDSRGAHVNHVLLLELDDFPNWKDMMLVYLDGLQPFLLEILKDGSYIPKSLASTP